MRIKVHGMGIVSHNKWIFFQIKGINNGEKSRLGQYGDKLSPYQVDKNSYI